MGPLSSAFTLYYAGDSREVALPVDAFPGRPPYFKGTDTC